MPRLEPKQVIRAAIRDADGYRLRAPASLIRGAEGQVLGSESGTSVDFKDFRAYQLGDDLRRVDWSVFARSDQLVIRQYQREVSPVLEILMDTSVSIGLHKGKAFCAQYIAAFVATASAASGWRPHLVSDGARVTGNDISHALAGIRFDTPGDPLEPNRAWPNTAAMTTRMVISDFLFPVDFDRFLTAIAGSSASLQVIQPLSESELAPKMRGGMRLIDVEDPSISQDSRLSHTSIERYKLRLHRHLDALATACRRIEASYLRLEIPDTFTDDEALRRKALDPLLRSRLVEAM